MDKLRRKPSVPVAKGTSAKFERYNLTENPFPSEPVVNKESTDKRINGDIYETALREPELSQIAEHFLKPPMADPAHLRLGYIVDTSYIGRGNGKSAFLVHLQNVINEEWCLNISDGANKCFALYVAPEPGGRTKTFSAFIDAILDAMFRSHIIRDSLSAIRLNAISDCYVGHSAIDAALESGDNIHDLLCNLQWYEENAIDISRVRASMHANSFLAGFPNEFPLSLEIAKHGLFSQFVSEQDFERYWGYLKKTKDKLIFLFSHLVRLFQAADFTGAFILVDDFERVPDFQGVRQRKDFALELRTVLYDGAYQSASDGFFAMLLVLHAGVPSLIREAWAESGMENRSPLSSGTARHVIAFEKLTKNHVGLLLKRYLDEYRIKPQSSSNAMMPFTADAIERMGELSEFNAARILAMAFWLLNTAADEGRDKIDTTLVENYRDVTDRTSEKEAPAAIHKAATTDLLKKAQGD